jgi:chromate transport protein ChrA
MACVGHRGSGGRCNDRRACCIGLPVSGIVVSVIAFLLVITPAVAIVVLVAWFSQPRAK